MPSKPSLNHAGETYHDFTVTRVVEIPELQCRLLELLHNPSGAQVMHIANEDPENLFCISLRTTPTCSNGVAHILEHTVLCGSEKYPVKDPFFAMTRRSLNTFMNAFTGSDFTCYPAASQVPKDFYNLLEVYIDAVFKPNLKKMSFLQEGHRLEFAIPSDPTSPLEYKGIVFNEMKGALTSPNDRLSEAISHSLFPDITYGINSGGNPKHIPELSYEELHSFHSTYYYPSRALFFFYGNMPLEEHLDFISLHALKGIKKVEPLPPIPEQPRMKEPLRKEEFYPIAAEEDPKDKTIVAMGWLTCHILEQQDLLALSVLDIILMDTDASPLKIALLKSGLCKQASSGLDPDISEIPYIFSFKGCNPEDADPIEALFRKTLADIVKEGIPNHMVESAVHQLEFFRSEITGDSAPFGLSLFMRSGLLKQHEGKPDDGLMIHTLFEALREQLKKNPNYLTEILSKYLLNNTHCVRIVMIPSKELAAKELSEERAVLDAIRSKLSESQVNELIQQAAELEAFQHEQEEQNLDVLPKVTLADVPKKSREYSLQKEKVGNLELYYHDTFTNGIVYGDLVFDVPELPEADLPLIRLFAALLSEVGCGGRDYKENLEYLQEHTGGVGTAIGLNIQASDHNQFTPSLYLKGKALHHKVDKFYTFIKEMATSADFTDTSRIKEVVQKYYTGMQSAMNRSALKYAINLSASGICVASKITNLWYGLDYYWLMKDLAANFDKRAGALVEKLQHLQKTLLCVDDAHLVLTCDSQMHDELKKKEFFGLANIELKSKKPWKGDYPLQPASPQGRIIASPVAFTGKAFRTISYTHPQTPALSIAACIMDNKTLHPRIREKGGAYGGGAVNNALSGNFYFYSYRDPNISKTFEAFQDSVKNVLAKKFTDADLEEAKLEIVQGLDSPVAPGSRGSTAYGWLREGKSTKVRQAFRDKLLALKKQDIVEAVEQQILHQAEQGINVVFASQELLERENKAFVSKGLPPLKLEQI